MERPYRISRRCRRCAIANGLLRRSARRARKRVPNPTPPKVSVAPTFADRPLRRATGPRRTESRGWDHLREAKAPCVYLRTKGLVPAGGGVAGDRGRIAAARPLQAPRAETAARCISRCYQAGPDRFCLWFAGPPPTASPRCLRPDRHPTDGAGKSRPPIATAVVA